MPGEYEPNDSRNVTGMSDQGMGTPGGADQQLGAERWGGDARKARQMEQRRMEQRQMGQGEHSQTQPGEEGAEVHFIADAQLNDALSGQQVQFESATGTQMEASEAAGQIREHMEVIGADGVHVGTVDAVEGHRIKLTRSDSGMGSHAEHHHYLSIGLVAEVEGDRVRLSANGAIAYEMLQEE